MIRIGSGRVRLQEQGVAECHFQVVQPVANQWLQRNGIDIVRLDPVQNLGIQVDRLLPRKPQKNTAKAHVLVTPDQLEVEFAEPEPATVLGSTRPVLNSLPVRLDCRGPVVLTFLVEPLLQAGLGVVGRTWFPRKGRRKSLVGSASGGLPRWSGWSSMPASPRMSRQRTTSPGDAWPTILPLREGALRVSEPQMFAWGRFRGYGRTDGRFSLFGVRPGSGNPVEQEDSRLRTAPSLPFDDVQDQKAGTTDRLLRFLERNPILIGPEQGPASASTPFDGNYITKGKGCWPGKVASGTE